MRQGSAVGLVLLVGLAACSSDNATTNDAGDGATDATTDGAGQGNTDAPLAEVSTNPKDGASTDGTVADGPSMEGSIESSTPDSAASDGPVVEAAIPEAASDVVAVDGSATTDSASDHTSPEAAAADAGVDAASLDGGTTDAGMDSAAATLPALGAADFPGAGPCPSQAILTNATTFAALQTALTSGTLNHHDTPFSADPNIFKQKCGLEGFWNPANATSLIPPLTSPPELVSLLGPSNNGHSGICATFASPSPSTDGFPAAGTYRKDFQAAYMATTYVVRVRATVTGSAAGQSFQAAGITYQGAGNDVATTLAYNVNGMVAAEASLWSSLVNAFSSSPSTYPTVTLGVSKTSGMPIIWTSKLELICASSM